MELATAGTLAFLFFTLLGLALGLYLGYLAWGFTHKEYKILKKKYEELISVPKTGTTVISSTLPIDPNKEFKIVRSIQYVDGSIDTVYWKGEEFKEKSIFNTDRNFYLWYVCKENKRFFHQSTHCISYDTDEFTKGATIDIFDRQNIKRVQYSKGYFDKDK